MHIDIQRGTDILRSIDFNRLQGFIGASSDACIKLSEREILPEHAKLSHVKNGIIITPCSVQAKVFINFYRIESSHILQVNDIINIGHYSLIIHPGSAPVEVTQNHIKIYHSKRNIMSVLIILVLIALSTLLGLFIKDNILNVANINKAQYYFERNDFDSAEKIADRIISKDKIKPAEKEQAKNLLRKIRFRDTISKAEDILKTKNYDQYEKSLNELYKLNDELSAITFDPVEQVKIRKIITDIESSK